MLNWMLYGEFFLVYIYLFCKYIVYHNIFNTKWMTVIQQWSTGVQFARPDVYVNLCVLSSFVS